jgi:ABC-type branched-subunit amino acid transport system permease subunit
MVGAVIIRSLQEILTILASGPVANTILGLILIGVILYLPSGIVPLVRERLNQSTFEQTATTEEIS